jgi:hypothetical protein
MLKLIREGLAKLFENPESLVILLGGVLVALGAAGGVTYNNFFPITQLWQQVLISVIGLLFALAGVILVQQKPRSPRPYGISITHPGKNESVRITTVKGVIRKRPPVGHALWLLRMYSDGKYVPLQEVDLPNGENEWEVKDCSMGTGAPGTSRTLGAFLVGPSGQVLLKYWSEASRRHRSLVAAVDEHNSLAESRIPIDTNQRYLPFIWEQTPDMIECHRVDVRLP